MGKVGVSAITIVGVTKGGRFEVHAFGHLHIPDLLIDDADRLHLHPLHLIAIQTVLTRAIDITLDACRVAGAVLFVTLGLLAGAVYPFHFLLSDDALQSSFTLDLDALLAAELIDALLIEGQVAGTGFDLAFEVAETNMIDLTALLVGEPFDFHRLSLEASFERVEGRADRLGFPVVFDGL
jgi:hypothetical protein